MCRLRAVSSAWISACGSRSTVVRTQDIKPSRNGIALRLCEWADTLRLTRRLIDAVNNDHPTLAVALPCYMNDESTTTIINPRRSTVESVIRSSTEVQSFFLHIQTQ